MIPIPIDRPHQSQRPLELTIELDPYVERQAPSGWLRAPAAPPRRFESYVHLIGALHEIWLGTAKPPSPPTRERGDR